MKNAMKVLGIVTLAVAIGIAMTACPSDSGGGDSTVAVSGVSLERTPHILAIGETEGLSAVVSPSDATDSTVTWASDKTAVATVDTNGKVTAVAPGTAKITVTTNSGDKTASVNVTVSFIGMRWIQAGTFTMGSSNELDYGAQPPHQVTLTSGFHMGTYQVTQALYEEVTGDNPSYFDGTDGREAADGEAQGRRPVEQVSWYDAVEFCWT